MTDTSQVPLIWTTKGNVPVDTLQLSTRWEITEDHIILVEEYTEVATGEVVRSSSHIHVNKPPEAIGAEQPIFA